MNCKERKDYEERIHYLEILHKIESDLFAQRIGELEKKMVQQQATIMQLEDLKIEQMKEIAFLEGK